MFLSEWLNRILGYRHYKNHDAITQGWHARIYRKGPGPTPWNLWNRKYEHIKNDTPPAGICEAQILTK
jgi:hypothetical protein